MIVNRVTNLTSQTATGTNVFSVSSSVGDLLAIAIVVDINITVTNVTDNKGNTWTLSTGGLSVGTGSSLVASSTGSTSGVTSFTIHSSGSGISIGGITATFYDVTSNTGAIINGVGLRADQVSFNPSISIGVPRLNFLVSALISQSSISAVSSPFTIENMNDSSMSFTATSAYNSVGNGSVTYTSTSSDPWGGIIVNFSELASFATQIGYFLVGP